MLDGETLSQRKNGEEGVEYKMPSLYSVLAVRQKPKDVPEVAS